MEQPLSKLKVIITGILLGAAVLLVFAPVRHHDFINLDDDEYVYNNPQVRSGITWEALKWAFTTRQTANWSPVTHVSHLLDVELFGLNPGGHHATSVLIHTANTVLLFWVLLGMTGCFWRSIFVAAVFGLHPLRAESVAWIAERKDVLSGFFWILTMGIYFRYVRRGGRWRYLPAAASLALGLMAKATLMTLPLVLLLLDYWPLKRRQGAGSDYGTALVAGRQGGQGYRGKSWKYLVGEKIPMFLLVVIFGVITYRAQQYKQAIWLSEVLPLKVRMANALVSYVRYLGMIFYPQELAVFYPHPGRDISAGEVIISLVLLAGIGGAIFFIVKRRRETGYLAVGWLWYLGTLVPVIGLIQTGLHARADRFTYIPAIGIALMVAWGINDIFAGWRYRRMLTSFLGVIVIVLLSLGAREQLRYWKNSFKLFERALAVTRDNFLAENHLGIAYLEDGQADKGLSHFRQALRIEPGYIEARSNLGIALGKLGRFAEAIEHFQRVVRARPDFAEGHNNLGFALLKQNKTDEAIEELRKALEGNEDYPTAHYNLARAWVEQGKYEEAEKHWRRLRISGYDIFAVKSALGRELVKEGRERAAARWYYHLMEEAPDNAYIHNELSWLLGTSNDSDIRDPGAAVELALKACALSNHKNPIILDTLAAAYAAGGDFNRAIETAEKALELAQANQQVKLIQEIHQRLLRYKAGESFRQEK